MWQQRDGAVQTCVERLFIYTVHHKATGVQQAGHQLGCLPLHPMHLALDGDSGEGGRSYIATKVAVVLLDHADARARNLGHSEQV